MTELAPMRPKRVLFFAEAVTLAHVARPLVLAAGLDPVQFEPMVACHPKYARFFRDKPWRRLDLDSIPSEQFLAALERGRPVFDLPTLRRYVREDLALIQATKPDLVVGDFRISLSVSARLAGIPYATVTNAYWSPYCIRQDFPLPDLPLTRMLPLALAQPLFRRAMPIAMRLHCAPMNTLRLESSLASFGPDLRRVYTDADWTLYADAAELFPTRPLPPNHRVLGPLLWSPPVPVPEWWNAVASGRPVVYLTLGSSGKRKALTLVLRALGELPVTVIASMAGSGQPEWTPPNLRWADYLPGTEAAARSSLVICNGGSPTSQQAIAAGVPLLCIPSNADQFLNADALARAGCATVLRADRLRIDRVQRAVMLLLETGASRRAAEQLKIVFEKYRPQADFSELAADIAAGREPAMPRRLAPGLQRPGGA